MKAGVTADMALRLSAWLGTSAEMWLGMQSAWDLWQAQRHSRQIEVKPIRLTAKAITSTFAINLPTVASRH